MCFTAVHVMNQSCPSLPMVRCVCRCQRLPTAGVFQERKTSSRARQRQTYKLRVGENLAGRERVFLRGLVRVFAGHLAEARHAAGERTLLQRQQVAAVQAVHGAPAHAPVEVVHGLALRHTQPELELLHTAHLLISPPAHVRKHSGHKKLHTGNMFRAAFKDDFSGRSYMMSLNTSRANKLIFYFTT